MHARVVTSKLRPGRVDQAIQVWQHQVIPTLETAGGFRHGYMTGDRNTGSGVVFTLWETEAAATSWNTGGRDHQLGALFAQHFTTPPAQEHFEVFIEV